MAWPLWPSLLRATSASQPPLCLGRSASTQPPWRVEIGGIVATILPAVRYIFMLMPYDGLTTAIVAVFVMKGPKEVRGSDPLTALR